MPVPSYAPPSALPSPHPTEAPEPAGPCPESGVRVTLGPTNAAMGLRALTVFLENCGTRPFEVSGYPDVAVLDGRHEELDVTVRRGTGAAGGTARPSTAAVRPGERARASVLWRNTVTRVDVPPTSGAYLRVAPGPGTPAQPVAPHDGPIDLGDTGEVEVAPWVPDAP
ncbi:DUF4232 domain-containing protein [Streptomyces sp. TRM49041]|uniref:DUF4232 domain-containing protein n=1 Tax=Streptomyces sp. TRM49041 TaxID=2603216 RepID=UPI0016568508|nr:DUF4232 domain-containing protein [Streptomyces sp. TRM49041]